MLELDERTVQETLDGLTKKHLVLERSGFGSRVPKYQHRFCNTGFGTLEFTPQETAIVCELLLRGPQTPGELRGRASRMAPMAEVGEVEAALHHLVARDDGPFVVRLAREAGRRDARYAHLFSGSVEGAAEGIEQYVAADEPSAPRADRKSMEERIAALEQRVEHLQSEIEGFKKG